MSGNSYHSTMLNERNKILLEIDRLLETFTEQYLHSRENVQIIPLIEIDLMKSSLQNLYQQLDHLSKIQNSSFNEAQAIVNQQIQPSIKNPVTQIADQAEYFESEIQMVKDNSIAFADLLLEKDEETPAIEKNPVQTFRATENKIPAQNIIVQNEIPAKNTFVEEKQLAESLTELVNETEINVISKKNIDVVIEKKTSATIHQSATLFDQPSRTLGEKFKEQETLYAQISKTRNDETVADKLHKKPLVDLKKSIGINERFAFINELFSGNQQLFNESIDKLNNCTNYDEANHELHNELSSKMGWNKQSPIFIELNDLVKRRFSV